MTKNALFTELCSDTHGSFSVSHYSKYWFSKTLSFLRCFVFFVLRLKKLKTSVSVGFSKTWNNRKILDMHYNDGCSEKCGQRTEYSQKLMGLLFGNLQIWSFASTVCVLVRCTLAVQERKLTKMRVFLNVFLVCC